MYLWGFLITAAVGIAAGAAAIVLERSLRRRGGRSADALRWVCLGAGVLGALMLVLGFRFPRLRGRQPAWEGAEFEPVPFTDPLVLSCGVGAFAVVLGVYLALKGDQSWATRVGLVTGGLVAAVWLFYLIGRFVG